jgi:hypothetical protein
MEKEKLVAGPRWAPDTKTDWLTVGRKLPATSAALYDTSCRWEDNNKTELNKECEDVECIFLVHVILQSKQCN